MYINDEDKYRILVMAKLEPVHCLLSNDEALFNFYQKTYTTMTDITFAPDKKEIPVNKLFKWDPHESSKDSFLKTLENRMYLSQIVPENNEKMEITNWAVSGRYTYINIKVGSGTDSKDFVLEGDLDNIANAIDRIAEHEWERRSFLTPIKIDPLESFADTKKEPEEPLQEQFWPYVYKSVFNGYFQHVDLWDDDFILDSLLPEEDFLDSPFNQVIEDPFSEKGERALNAFFAESSNYEKPKLNHIAASNDNTYKLYFIRNGVSVRTESGTFQPHIKECAVSVDEDDLDTFALHNAYKCWNKIIESPQKEIEKEREKAHIAIAETCEKEGGKYFYSDSWITNPDDSFKNREFYLGNVYIFEDGNRNKTYYDNEISETEPVPEETFFFNEKYDEVKKILNTCNAILNAEEYNVNKMKEFLEDKSEEEER